MSLVIETSNMPIKKQLTCTPKELSLFKEAKFNKKSGAYEIGQYIYDHGSPAPDSLGPEVYENYRIAHEEPCKEGFQFLESRYQTLNKRQR